MDLKLLAAALVYTGWRLGLSILVSPLGLGILTAEQMGYTVNTVPMGLLIGAITLIIIAVLASTKLGVSTYARGLTHITTREEFEQFWRTTLRGCDDGIISETYWSGTILPLLLIGFQQIGLPYPFTVVPSIFVRWIGHVGAHLLFPRGESGEREFGGVGLFAFGFAFTDVINSVAFLISGNILAPAMLHHLSGYISTWVGNKKRVAKRLNIPLD